MATVPKFRDFVLAREGDPNPAIRFEDQSWTYSEFVAAAADRAAFMRDTHSAGPLHVGVLLDNVPEYSFWIAAAALARGVVVGINPTRRGTELARDITHTDCHWIVTEDRYVDLIEGLDLDVPAARILNIDHSEYGKALAPYAGSPIPEVEAQPDDTLLLLFTSGTSGAPKAVICTQKKLAFVSQSIVANCGLSDATVSYQVMPMFHSNGLFTAYGPTIYCGGTAVLRRKFSASNAIPDIKKYGCTYFNYVGKPLSYILAQPERSDDAENPLEIVFGNEGADIDIWRFSQRFKVPVVDGYGSTETGASVSRTLDMPKGALGEAPDGTKILDPETGQECPRADFDAQGRLLNPEQAIGEIVNTSGANLFEGYYKNDEANAQRMRGGMYWTGDLAYRDKDGYFYFAGRDFEWLRVDGENFAAAPVERILARFPGVVLAAVYAVPDAEVGDQVMAALQFSDLSEFDPAAFDAFLQEQEDLGTKWSPRYVRLSEHLPVTQTAKVMKRTLRTERWECGEPVFFRPAKGAALQRLISADVARLRQEFEARGRDNLLI